MKKDDIINVQILDGGLFKITTPDAISPANHTQAEELLSAIEKDAGGPVTVTPLKKGALHTHSQGAQHHHH